MSMSANSRDPGHAINRRVLIRHPCEVDSSCVPLLAAALTHWTATIANISAGGLMLIVDRRFEKGTLLDVEMPTLDGSECHLMVSVAHVTRRDDGRYSVGCRFARVLTDAGLQSLLDAANASCALELITEKSRR